MTRPGLIIHLDEIGGILVDLVQFNMTGTEVGIFRYLGMPVDEPTAYAAADPFSLVSRIEGRVLLMAGTLDTSTLGDAR